MQVCFFIALTCFGNMDMNHRPAPGSNWKKWRLAFRPANAPAGEMIFGVLYGRAQPRKASPAMRWSGRLQRVEDESSRRMERSVLTTLKPFGRGIEQRSG